MSLTLLGLCAASALSVCLYLFVAYQARGVPVLKASERVEPSEWPRVSLILPARNEALTIEAALSSLLLSDYPDLEVHLVNDRSTDATGELLDAIASRDPRLVVHHVSALPSGWLGKLHAMHIASRAVSGEYVIYADADVHFAPKAIKSAVAWAEGERLDMLALIPKMTSEGLLLSATLGSFGGLFLAGTKARQVNRGKPGAYAGVGAFNMVRRSVFERSAGWEWLKGEIADDLGLAYIMHEAGAAARIAMAPELLSLRWYESLTDFVLGLEKNIFPVVARFSALRALVLATGAMVLPLSPLMLLSSELAWAGALTLSVNALLCYLAHPRSVRRLAYLLSPLAPIVMAFIMTRSTLKALKSGQVEWRGTRYDLDTLKASQRVVI